MGRSKESIERVASITGCCTFSTSLLRLLLLTCLVALAMFTALTYPLLGSEQVRVVLPDLSVANWHKDAIAQDYHLRDSEHKIADLNESFLSFAAIDPNEEQDRRKIKMIMDGNELDLRSSHLGRSSINYQRRMDHYVDLDRPRARARPRFESWLLELRSPRFRGSWPRFRQLLQAWLQNKRHDPRVMGELWETVKKPIDDFYRRVGKQALEEGKRYKTCAVVGNSGILLNRTFGSFIDSHDMVMRLNNAKVAGFESSVGTKTTLSFVNSNIYHSCSRRLRCFCHPYGNVPIVMYLCQVQHLMDIAFCEQNHVAPVLVTDARFDALCARIVKWYSVKHFVESTGNPISRWEKDHNGREFHYSSGFQAIVLALGICEQVDIFGFGKSPTAKHHYHTNQKAELDLHDYAAEYLFYDDVLFNRTSNIPFLSEVGIRLPRLKIYR